MPHRVVCPLSRSPWSVSMAKTADAQSSINVVSQGSSPGDLVDFLDKLDLHDEDFDDVIVAVEER